MQRNKALIMGAAVFGILAVGLTLMSLFGRQAPPPAPEAVATPAPSKQLVARRTIPPRTVVTADMVTEDEINTPVAGGYTATADVVGKLTGEAIPQGAAFTAASLVEPVKRATPGNFAVPPGLRAVAVMVDPNTTVGGIVDVGDRVDVVVVHKLKYKNEADMEGETRSGRTIGQNLLVLATDAALKRASVPPTPAPGSPEAANATPAAPPPPPPPPPAPGAVTPKARVVVAASPAVAERLAAAQGLGEIHLTLRDGIGRDALPVPEAFEYPIRTLGRTVPRKGQATTNVTVSRPSRSYEPQPVLPQQVQQPMTPPMPPYQVPAPPAAASNNVEPATEVTVIRGTEKSKVIVPQR